MRQPLRSALYAVFAILSGAPLAVASPMHPSDDFSPLTANSTEDSSYVLAPYAAKNCSALSCEPLRSKLLQEISGVDTSRLTYIYRLWGNRQGFGSGLPHSTVEDNNPISQDWSNTPIGVEFTNSDQVDAGVELHELGQSTEFTTTVNAVPEPTSLAMLTFAVAGAVAYRRWQRRK